MLRDYGIKYDEVFPVCVMATMSAGKSTFLNSIFGVEILPEKNEACTARALAVINDCNEKSPKAYIIKKDGKKLYVELDNRTVIEKINNDDNIENVLIKVSIPFIDYFHKPIVFFDTPGVNNSADLRHGERTSELLEKISSGLIIYVLNATQLATNDDFLLLQQVADHVKKNPNVNLCFVLNKIDMLDEDKESIDLIISSAKSYISEFKIENPLIFPLSALSAKVLKLLLFDKKLTKTEQRHLIEAYEEYKTKEKSMLKYSYSYNELNKEYYINDRFVSEYELKRAIENTGIKEIENQIIKFALNNQIKTTGSVFDTSLFDECDGVYSKKRKMKNFVNYEGKAKWICKKCKQVNGDNKQCLNCNEFNIRWNV